MRIAAIILAAGEGRRMGGPKALLRIGNDSFLARTASLLSRPGVSSVIAVLGHHADRVRAESGLPASVTVVQNERYQEGMLSSILCGLDTAEALGSDAILLHPVDHPLVSAETVDRVIRALEAGAIIAVPSWENRRGHPGGFGRPAWSALREVDPTAGARSVLASHPEWIAHVEGDSGCVRGINTTADYDRWIKH